MKTYITILALILLQVTLQAQVINEKAINKLKKELETTGISQVFSFKDVIIDKENDIIRIQFKFNSDDAAKNDTLWRILKRDFYKQKNKNIRRYLYFYSINTFKIRTPKNVLLEIRQSYINQDCPFIQFYYNEDTNKFTGDEKEKICMAEYNKKISLNTFIYFNKEFITDKSDIAKEVYYVTLVNHFRQFYKKGGFEKNSTKQKFKSKYIRGNSVLTFEVENLEKEVLDDAGENFVYSMLEFLYDEKFVPYEHLKFEIRITPNKKTNLMQLDVKVTGRYGSGYYRNSKWKTMSDFDEGFPDYINDYAIKVTEEVIRRVTKFKNYGN